MLTLAQFIFNTNIGIDQLFMSAYSTNEYAASSPGRMAPGSAFCFILIGVDLVIMAVNHKQSRHYPMIVGILGSLIGALSTVPFFGYLAGTTGMYTYGWASLIHMAIHTSLGFMMLGISIMSFAWVKNNAGKGGAPRWLPVLVGNITVIITLLLWQALFSEQRTNTGDMVTSEASVTRNRITESMISRIEILSRMGGALEHIRQSYSRAMGKGCRPAAWLKQCE